MFWRRKAHRDHARELLAWFGLLLMLASLVWFELLPPAELRTSIAVPPKENAFGVVVIDAGHGGEDSGAIQAGIVEKDLSLDVAQRLQRLLESQGLVTDMTRIGDNFLTLAARAAVANRQHDAVFVSIHFDDAARTQATGVETYYAAHQVSSVPSLAAWLPFLPRPPPDTWNEQSQSLAGFIQEALVRRTQALNRGTRAEQFFVIANVRHPAVLVEGGFLTNKDDVGKLMNPEYREQMAAAICEGIFRYREVLKQQQPVSAPAMPGA